MKTRAFVLMGGVLLSVLATISAHAGPDAAAAEELGKAAKAASELDAYSFTSKVTVIGFPMFNDPVNAEGTHKDGTTHVSGTYKKNKYEGFTRDGEVVSRRNDEPWARPDAPGGGMGAMSGIASQLTIIPHEEVRDLPGKLADVAKGEKKEDVDGHACTVFEGELTEEAAKSLIPPAAAAFGLSGDVVGLARIWVDDEGVVRRFETTAAIRANFQGQDLEIGMNRTTNITDVGSATLEVPPEVEELLKKPEEEEGSGTTVPEGGGK